jgi:pimeloyl-ACP methyl ester carboxylesterase
MFLFLGWTAACLVAVLLTLRIFQSLGLRADARRYPPPGRLVDSGSARLHLYSTGDAAPIGEPTVILEAGLVATSLNWREFQAHVSAFARVVSYDRAGLGWSEPCRTPRTPAAMATELRDALAAASIEPPYIVVGHSFGGLVARQFALLHPADVAGLVLIDPMPLEGWAPLSDVNRRLLARGLCLARRGAWLARCGVVRLVAATVIHGPRLFPRKLANAAYGSTPAVVTRVVGRIGKLPREIWPMVAAHWSNPKSFEAFISHLDALPACAAEMRSAAPLLHLPVTVLTPTAASDLSHAEMRAIAPHARHIVARASGHWIHLDQPELVAAVVREMVEAAHDANAPRATCAD